MLGGFRLLLLAIISALATVSASAQSGPPSSYMTQVVTVGGGLTRTPWVRYLLITRTGTTPTQAAILFAGGDGLLSLSFTGAITTDLAQNFLVRSRYLFVDDGIATAVVDAPNGQAMDGNVRLSASYAQLMSQVVADVRSKTNAKRVWLVGTSAGTLSTANVAARYPIQVRSPFPLPGSDPARPNGLVLTSTQSTLVSGFCGKTVFDAALAQINVPSYVVAHHDDACECSPATAAPTVLAALTGTTQKAKTEFTGGSPPQSTACNALSPHGFFGIEDQVVTNITTWMKRAK